MEYLHYVYLHGAPARIPLDGTRVTNKPYTSYLDSEEEGMVTQWEELVHGRILMGSSKNEPWLQCQWKPCLQVTHS